jgi:hypothetical protein
MKSNRNSLAAGHRGIVGLALLALAFAAGGSAVRAAAPEAAPSTLQNIVLDPIAQIVIGVERRIADIEATVAAFAESFTSARIVTQQLCVADGSGAQTCITKAQLDALLKGAVQVNQAAAATDRPAPPAGESVTPTPEVATAVPSAPPPATEQPAVTAGEPGTPLPAVAAVMPPAIDPPTAAAGEAIAPMPEVAVPPATKQPTIGETPLPAVAPAMPPATEPVETVIAASPKPEAVIAAEQRGTDEEPAHAGSVVTNAPPPEPNAVPVEEAPALDRLE